MRKNQGILDVLALGAVAVFAIALTGLMLNAQEKGKPLPAAPAPAWALVSQPRGPLVIAPDATVYYEVGAPAAPEGAPCTVGVSVFNPATGQPFTESEGDVKYSASCQVAHGHYAGVSVYNGNAFPIALYGLTKVATVRE